MKRKVIKQGNNTLTVTLPRKWTNKFGIKAGDEINVEEQEKSLLISSHKTITLTEITLQLNNLNQPLVWRHVIGAYRAGYDSINIKFNPSATYENLFTSLADFNKKITMNAIEVIQDVANRLYGMGIIEQKKDYCIIKDISEITDKEFDNTVRRIFFLIEGMGEDNIQLLKTRDQSLLRAIDITDTNIDRFSDYCLRVLNKKGYKNFKKTSIVYSTLLILEYIGDEYKRVARIIFKNKNSSKIISSIFEDINDLFSMFHKLFYDFSSDKTIKLYEETENLNKKIETAKLNEQEKDIVHHIKKISRFLTDLLQLRIDLES